MTQTTTTRESQQPPDHHGADHHDQPEPPAESASVRRRRLPWILAIVASVAGAAAAVLFLGGSSGDAEVADPSAARNTATVVATDLIEETSYEGTLGTLEGDVVVAQTTGTVTAVAAAGTTVAQGDVLYAIDGEPTAVLYGNTPAYRDLAITDETTTVGAAANGTVTAVAVAAGDTIAQGDALYWIDGEPVVALYGDVPAYRTLADLSDNMTGEDILQLETALTDLGYDPDRLVTVDDEFSAATEDLVERWQEGIGAEVDGTVDLGDIVFIDGPTTIGDVLVAPGDTIGSGTPVLSLETGAALQGADVLQLEQALAELGYATGTLTIDGVFTAATEAAVIEWQIATGMQPDGVLSLGEVVFLEDEIQVADEVAAVGARVSSGAAVVTTSSADKVVRVDLPATDQGILDEGDAVVVELPGGVETAGTVTSVATTATTGQAGDASFEVVIALDDPEAAAGLDEAPVDVAVISDSVTDVVAVPVSALVALAEGGYAVEVQTDGGGIQLIAVEPGFFADGLVEVESDGLEAGMTVIVP